MPVISLGFIHIFITIKVKHFIIIMELYIVESIISINLSNSYKSDSGYVKLYKGILRFFIDDGIFLCFMVKMVKI